LHGKKAMDPQWKFLNADRSDMALTDYPVNRLLATKEPIYTMITGINRPATEDLVWVVVNGYVDLKENGSVERAVISFVDITKRIHSEEALTKSRTLLAEAQNLAKLGAFSFDVKTMHQTWTEETFRIMEVDMGGGAPEVPEGVDFIAPKYRSMADKAIQMAIEKGEPYDQEWEIVTAKGNRKWARTIGKANYENDEIISISGSFQDITDRKLTEETMSTQAEILSNISEAVYLVGMKDGIILETNSEFESMFGYEAGEMVGKQVSIVNAPTKKTPGETVEDIMAVLLKEGQWSGEVHNIKKDGTMFWCSARVSVFEHTRYGEVLVSVHRDTTEQKLSELELAGYKVELEERVEKRTRELEEKNKELDETMRVFVGRETKILELQNKVKALQGK